MGLNVLSDNDISILRGLIRWWKQNKFPKPFYRRRSIIINTGDPLRRAVCRTDPGQSDIIAADLFHASTGVRQTSGNESNITLYCLLTGTPYLNSTIRRLAIDEEVFVTQSVYDNNGTPEIRWYVVEGFQYSKDCICNT